VSYIATCSTGPINIAFSLPWPTLSDQKFKILRMKPAPAYSPDFDFFLLNPAL
jgi:hypothetical protein